MSQIILISDSDEDTHSPDMKDEMENRNRETQKDEKKQNIDEDGQEEIVKEEKEKDENSNQTTPKLTTEELFAEFSEFCLKHLKNNPHGQKIMKYLLMKYKKAPPAYKTSRRYRKLLDGYVYKLRKGSRDVVSYINDIISMLECNSSKSETTPEKTAEKHQQKESNSNGECAKKRRIGLEPVKEIITSEESVPVLTKSPAEVTGDDTEHVIQEQNLGPSTSTAVSPSTAKSLTPEKLREKKRLKKIRYLEKLLKKLSEEITRLQQQELSFDDMDQEDSTYIQESLLKKRSLKVYKELCRLNKVPVVTGRVSEQRVKVRSSRYDEINKKVELYINNPNTSFPDFGDIYFLVKKANEKKNLNLGETELMGISQNIFTEVGEKLQKRRHNDFVYEFGCSIVDKVKNDPDPASSDPELLEKLVKNRSLASVNLNSVIEKYSSMQYEFEERATTEHKDEGLEEDLEEEDEEDPQSDENEDIILDPDQSIDDENDVENLNSEKSENSHSKEFNAPSHTNYTVSTDDTRAEGTTTSNITEKGP